VAILPTGLLRKTVKTARGFREFAIARGQDDRAVDADKCHGMKRKETSDRNSPLGPRDDAAVGVPRARRSRATPALRAPRGCPPDAGREYQAHRRLVSRPNWGHPVWRCLPPTPGAAPSRRADRGEAVAVSVCREARPFTDSSCSAGPRRAALALSTSGRVSLGEIAASILAKSP
jgi:hypothetical protein